MGPKTERFLAAAQAFADATLALYLASRGQSTAQLPPLFQRYDACLEEYEATYEEAEAAWDQGTEMPPRALLDSAGPLDGSHAAMIDEIIDRLEAA